MSEQRDWHYLEICRGRYLCQVHGAFCDSSDDYLDRCILCDGDAEKAKNNWRHNHIDRGLQIMRGLQNRSARNAGVVAGLFGVLTAFLLLNKDNIEVVREFVERPLLAGSIVFGMMFGLVSIGFFLSSMAHMPTTTGMGFWGLAKPSFKSMKMAAWEDYISSSLAKFERRHSIGIYCFSIAVSVVVASIAFAVTQSI